MDRPRVSRRELALGAAAILGTTACGGASEAEDTAGGDDSAGGEDAHEMSCAAGRCGSHHETDCPYEDQLCPAPPYGAPPFDPIV